MTEAEWRACDDPHAMLNTLFAIWRRPSSRRLRLFGCACLRHVPRLIEAEGSLAAVEAVEQFADGLVTNVELSKTFSKSWSIRGDHWRVLTMLTPTRVSELRSAAATIATDGEAERRYQADVLRDIFGSRRRGPSSARVIPAWHTSTVVSLAEGIYADRAFDRMPILADALQDAGCDDADILAHCRGDGPHVRGCWVVDLILGKV